VLISFTCVILHMLEVKSVLVNEDTGLLRRKTDQTSYTRQITLNLRPS